MAVQCRFAKTHKGRKRKGGTMDRLVSTKCTGFRVFRRTVHTPETAVHAGIKTVGPPLKIRRAGLDIVPASGNDCTASKPLK